MIFKCEHEHGGARTVPCMHGCNAEMWPYVNSDRYIPEGTPQPVSEWSDSALVLAAKRALVKELGDVDGAEARTRLTRIAHRLMREERAPREVVCDHGNDI